MECIECSGRVVKNGKCPKGVQRFTCTGCRRSFKEKYAYKAYGKHIDPDIMKLLKEGLGIRAISRVLGISKTTVARRILLIASKVRRPVLAMGETYELDELCTFVGNKRKRIWVAYAISRRTGIVANFRVGTRCNRTLRPVVETLVLARAKSIYSDGLSNYRSLIPKELHQVKRFGTNHIERMHLTLRTQLKRLSRRTICFSRSMRMLSACLTIYFWA